ncbi:MAG: hypothetical protein M3388_00930 [Acidobacteriota bacterium]|nr:hypothetical protein [Acidobacteriota bacterium]
MPKADEDDTSQLENDYERLEICLKKLPDDQHRIIVGYYREEKSPKIENRRELAKTFGISVNALQVKASRIRAHLKHCLRICVGEKRRNVKGFAAFGHNNMESAGKEMRENSKEQAAIRKFCLVFLIKTRKFQKSFNENTQTFLIR